MSSSSVQTFTEPGEYGAAIRAVKAEMTITARGTFAAKLTRIDLHHLWMQRFADNLPRVAHSAAGTGRAIVSFRTEAGPELLWSGTEVASPVILRHCNADEAFQRSSGFAAFGSMSLPIDKMAALAGAMAGCDLGPPGDTLSVAPSPAAMRRLQRLHAAAGLLAEDAPEIIAHAEAARGLENALIEAMVSCLATHDRGEDVSAKRRHETIMRRFYAAIAQRPDEALYIPDICAAIGVPQRTLNVCCHENLGTGPKHYLLLRRMNLARQALHRATPANTTVTQIAADFGFWSFGRFAGEYYGLFGETPSATLRGEPQ